MTTVSITTVENSVTVTETGGATAVVTVPVTSVLTATNPGPAGPGVPVGGATGQVLTKTSATDYATAWQTPSGGGGGSTSPGSNLYLNVTCI